MAWRTRGHRGDLLEDLIDISNEYYRVNEIARVDKIATPIKVVEQNNRGQVILGFFEKRSTVDYVGLCQGIPLCFDAKETSAMSIPLANFHDHQIEYMKDFRKQGGISFFLVYFKAEEKFFLVPLELVIEARKNAESGGRKSISFALCEKKAIPVGFLNHHLLHYLPAINVYLDQLQAEKERELASRP